MYFCDLKTDAYGQTLGSGQHGPLFSFWEQNALFIALNYD
jgi:hypothetical protein